MIWLKRFILLLQQSSLQRWMKNKLDSLKVKQKIFEHTRSPSIKAWLLIELMDPKQIVPIVPLPNYLLSKPVRPDTGITISPNVSKSCPNFGQTK